MDEQRGDGAATLVHLGFDHRAGARAVWIGFGLDLGLGYQLDCLEQRGHSRLSSRRNRDGFDIAAVFGDHDTEIGQLLFDAVGVSRSHVHFVDGNDDRYVRGAGVVNCFTRLGHDPVVGGHDDDRNVGDLCTTSTHGGKRLVARRVKERDRVAINLDLIGANVLGDATRFARGDTRIANDVEQTGLTVIDVTHDRDYWRSRHEHRRVFLFFRGHARRNDLGDAVAKRCGCDGRRGRSDGARGILLANFEAQVSRDDRGRVVIERLVDRRDGAVGEQRLDDLCDRHAKDARQVGDAHDRRKLNWASLGGARRGGISGFGAPLKSFELAAASTTSLARAIRRA